MWVEVGSYVTDVYNGEWSISYDPVKHSYSAVLNDVDDVEFDVEFHPFINYQDSGGSDLYLEEYFTNTLERIKLGARNQLPMTQYLIFPFPLDNTLEEGVIYWKTILFDPIHSYICRFDSFKKMIQKFVFFSSEKINRNL